ncbi:MAG: OmpA family protein [Reyranella sp.]|uniref:Lpg1974 family pore-forming outer membrane protein n=1 Tax=Reyranella sp. TaxID=1929291 RepID=UPI001AC1899E|nr:Lpg1974 family pore-forming outer membrane protein [Reyranella sp.]MBN9088351.1 OmpA family protein [Reyranella sp.]
MDRIAKLIALAGLIAAIAASARAQVPEQQGFFGNIDGRWMWLGGNRVTVGGASSDVTNGPGGQIMIGYKIDPYWDVALAGDVQGLLSHLTKFQNGTISVDTNHQHFDLELGYSRDWWRVNGGLRGIHYKQGATYNVAPLAGFDQREMYGIGPKIGAGVRLPIAESWAVVGGADAALLYTNYTETGNGVLLNNTAYWQFVPQLSAELGINWRSSDTPSLSITTGARVATSFNTAITGDASRQGALVEFGPFVRMAYNFAGPSRSARLAVKEEREIWTNAPPTGSRRYTAYFGFERSELGLVGNAVVRQAADDIKRGRPAIIAIAAIDRDNGSAYSRTLSLRRADAIREALIRAGVSPAQIDVGSEAEAPQLTPIQAAIAEPQGRGRISY